MKLVRDLVWLSVIALLGPAACRAEEQQARQVDAPSAKAPVPAPPSPDAERPTAPEPAAPRVRTPGLKPITLVAGAEGRILDAVAGGAGRAHVLTHAGGARGSCQVYTFDVGSGDPIGTPRAILPPRTMAGARLLLAPDASLWAVLNQRVRGHLRAMHFGRDDLDGSEVQAHGASVGACAAERPCRLHVSSLKPTGDGLWIGGHVSAAGARGEKRGWLLGLDGRGRKRTELALEGPASGGPWGENEVVGLLPRGEDVLVLGISGRGRPRLGRAKIARILWLARVSADGEAEPPRELGSTMPDSAGINPIIVADGDEGFVAAYPGPRKVHEPSRTMLVRVTPSGAKPEIFDLPSPPRREGPRAERRSRRWPVIGVGTRSKGGGIWVAALLEPEGGDTALAIRHFAAPPAAETPGTDIALPEGVSVSRVLGTGTPRLLVTGLITGADEVSRAWLAWLD